MTEQMEDEYMKLLDEKESLLRVVRDAEALVLTYETLGFGLGTGPGSVFQLKRSVDAYRDRFR